jgi:hypothetical protein
VGRIRLTERLEGFAILFSAPLPFPPFLKLDERYCAENEQAQYYEYGEAIRRRYRQIIWQLCGLHKQIVSLRESGALI